MNELKNNACLLLSVTEQFAYQASSARIKIDACRRIESTSFLSILFGAASAANAVYLARH